MKSLTVTLNYSSTEFLPAGEHLNSPLALPLRVLDAQGGLIAEGVASGSHPAVLRIPDIIDSLFVRLTWPSGKTQTKRVTFQGLDSQEIQFTDASISRNEWSAWAIPRLRKSLPADNEAIGELNIERYRRAWLRLWQFKGGKWTEASLTPNARYRNDVAKQVDLKLESTPWCVQVGGLKVPWRLVSLPGGGNCRILLTPNDSPDPRADPLKIVVTGFRSDAETLLEFLSRDSIRAAKSLASFQPLAVRLLADKTEDPIAAVAGAYFLLRTEGWSRIPSYWYDNLNHMFPWIPDVAVIRCVVMLRAGLSSGADELRARELLADCMHRGLPIFAEGLSLMQEAASVLRSHSKPDSDGVFQSIQRLAASQAWGGAALSFYGEHPSAPSPEKVFGMPGRGRYPGTKRRPRRNEKGTGRPRKSADEVILSASHGQRELSESTRRENPIFDPSHLFLIGEI